MDATGRGEEVELIESAIQQLLQSSNLKNGDDDDHLLLTKLLSQLESLRGEDEIKQTGSLDGPKEPPLSTLAEVEPETETSDSNSGISAEELAKEIKIVKKQNRITHWLLSALILLTVTWQLSEVSLILKVKHGISHPFKSLGSAFAGMFRGPSINGDDVMKQVSSSSMQQQIESSLPLKLPELPHMDLELPHMDLPGLVFNGEEED